LLVKQHHRWMLTTGKRHATHFGRSDREAFRRADGSLAPRSDTFNLRPYTQLAQAALTCLRTLEVSTAAAQFSHFDHARRAVPAAA
jgi:hypothetical protein